MTISLSLTSLALLVLCALLVGLALGWLTGSARARAAVASGTDASASARTEAAQWRARAEELATRAALAEERAEKDGAVLRALAPVRSQLEQVGTQVARMEQERSAQHAALAEQLRSGALTDRRLLEATTQLSAALHSRSSRGLWGEVELARILEASGMMPHVDFAEQRSVGSVLAQRSAHAYADGSAQPRPAGAHSHGQDTSRSARPDVTIHLPGDGYLALDAKAPMDAYLRACQHSEESERQAGMKEHAAALRQHVDALAGRSYARLLGRGPDVVILFVPAEPVLAAALEADPTLMEYALGKQVCLTSPASLLPLLRVCATSWAQAQVAEDAAELLALGRTLYERLGVVAGHLDAVGTALSRSVSAYNRAVASIESRLLVTARSFEGLSAPEPPSPISAEAAQVRTFTAPELTEPAGS